MIVTKEQQEAILNKYIKENHNTDECIGFIDGINEALELVNKLSIPYVSGSLDADYWSERCKLAETCNEESPCDPDITSEQIEAWNKYHNFIKVKGQKNYR